MDVLPKGEGATRPLLTDAELVDAYLKGEVEGQHVMTRLLEKIGLGDRASEPLVRQDGTRLTDADGQTLTAQDYLTVAGNHGNALPIILQVAAMSEADPLFSGAQKAISGIVSGYLPPVTPGPA